MIKLYADASFSYTQTEKTTENVVRGKIAISNYYNLNVVEKVAVEKVPNLLQYINILELIAIARAVELACEMKERDRLLEIHTDSQVAVSWANTGKVKQKVRTEAHTNALEYLRRASIKFGGRVSFHYVPRNNNPAGHLLQAELDKGREPYEQGSVSVILLSKRSVKPSPLGLVYKAR